MARSRSRDEAVVLRLGAELCRDFDASSRREWWEANGMGGFAGATLAGASTRRYHGLLTAALNPPVGRHLLLAKMEEALVIDGRRHELSTNCYPGTVQPRGYEYLTAYCQDPLPRFTFEAEGVVLEKSLFLPHGRDTVVLEYRLLHAPPGRHITLDLRPLIAFRDYHALTRENSELCTELSVGDHRVTVAPYAGLPALHFIHTGASLHRLGYWHRRLEYREELERGLDYQEDLYSPFGLTFHPVEGEPLYVTCGREALCPETAAQLRREEEERRQKLVSHFPVGDGFARTLALAADAFVVRRGGGYTIIAGYPWFTDWGRDTMIALPGLTLVTGRPEIARDILREFARHVDKGLIPNRFPDRLPGGETEAAEYNTVDATLWMFEALRSYLCYTGDLALARELYPTLLDVLEWHLRGTRHRIGVDGDGLLHAGEPGVQLTWMDAKVGDWVVTPRHGKPVEIQALWYHALRITEALARRFADPLVADEYGRVAEKAAASFNRLFWNEEAGCLYDTLGEDGVPDPSIRPNQVIACSLAYGMLPTARARRLLKVVEERLLTPRGLRTLDPADPRYQPHYGGDVHQRDAAYHQGTVWPWLLGPMASGYVRAFGGSARARARAREWLEPLRDHFLEAGIGHVSEVFDGDAPHRPGGCPAQAWSTAEVLRAWMEDVQNRRPPGPLPP